MGVGEGDAVGVGEGEAVGVGEGDAVGVGLGVLVAVTVGDGDVDEMGAGTHVTSSDAHSTTRSRTMGGRTPLSSLTDREARFSGP